MLGTIDHGQVFGLLDGLAGGDARGLLAAVAELAEQGADFAGVLAELISTLQRVAIAQVLPEAADNSLGDQQRVLDLAGRISAEDVQLFYQLALHGRRDLPLAPDPRGGFEMALLRMLAFRPGTLQHTGPAGPAPAAVPPADDAGPGKSPGISQPGADSHAPGRTAQPAPAAPVAAQPSAPPQARGEPAVDTAPAPAEAEASPPAPRVAQAEPPPAPADEPPAWLQDTPPDDSYAVTTEPVFPEDEDDGDIGDGDINAAAYLDDWQPAEEPAAALAPEDEVSDLPPATGLAARWLDICPRLGVAGLTQSIAAHCQLVAIDGAVWRLHLDPGHSALYNDNHRQRLEKAIAELEGTPVTLEVLVQAPDQETPAIAAARQRVARQQQAEASIHADPLVQALINNFAAQICADSIRPIDA